MPAPIGEKSLKYRKQRKRSVSCWALCCAVVLYMVWILGFTTLMLAVFELGGVTPVLRLVVDWAVVPAVSTAVGPAASCVAALGSAVSYVVNATYSLANHTDDGDLLLQAVGDVLVSSGGLDAAQGVSALQRALGEGATGPAGPAPAVEALAVAGGRLWPPFRPAVKRYQVHLDDRLADRCGAEGCSGGAPDIEVEMVLRRAGTVRVDRDVVQNASGTLRRRVPLEQLFRDGERPQRHQAVVVQVTETDAGKPHSDFYVLKVVRPPARRQKRGARARRVVGRRLADRADLGDTVLLDAEGLVASEEQQLPNVQDQVSLVKETSADADGADADADVEDDADGDVENEADGEGDGGENATSEDVAPEMPPIDDGAEVILDKGSRKVFLESNDGYCDKVPGIFESGLKEMNLWSVEQDHLVCFPSKRGGHVGLRAQSDPPLKPSERGDFGFGEGLSIGLRPNIETNAIWPLENGVSSLPVSPNPIKLMGLRIEEAGGKQVDLPLVMASSRVKDWALELNFMDPSKGNCEPDASNPGVRRFACRAKEPGAEVKIFVLCDICSPKAGEGGRTLSIQQEKNDGNTLDVGTRRLQEDGSAVPWVGWATNAPSKRGYSFFTIAVGEGPEGSEEESNVEYQIGLVVGQTRMPWDASNISPGQWEALGSNLSLLGLASVGMYFLVMAMQAFGLPAPTLAGLPTLSAAVASMQLLAIIGRQIAEPPVRLEAFARPLPPVEMVSTVAYAFLAVVVLHALAVGRHVLRNGSGSAESLPHGLWMGAWELRAFNVLVLPLAFRGATLALVCCIPDYSATPRFVVANFLETTWGFSVLLGLLAVPAYVVYKLRGWFYTEQVIGMVMPGSSRVVFVDRTCDQLRAIPVNVSQVATYGRARKESQAAEGAPSSSRARLACSSAVRIATALPSALLDFLASLPGWSFSPTAATISEIEHRGSPGRESALSAGAWGLVWEPGPWGKAGSTSKHESIDDDLSKLPSERVERERADKNQELARKNSEKRASFKSGEGLKTGLVRAETDIGVWHGQPASRKYGGGAEVEQEKRPKFTPVMFAHPIRATTKFVYMGGGRNGRIAGVAGLPWIDCAVPAQALEELEDELGRVELRVSAGQLSGACTSGRLGACFDWTDRVAWRWPAEVVGKILLAFYLAALPYTAAYNAPVAWMALHAAVVLGLLALGVATIFAGPHTSFVDNCALASWMLMACVGIFMYVGGVAGDVRGAFVAAMSMLCFTAAPVVLFFLTSLFLIALSLATACADLRWKVVPAAVQNWILEGESLALETQSEKGGGVAASGYSRLDPSAQAQGDPGAQAVPHEDHDQKLGESSFPDCRIVGPKAAPLGPLTAQLPARSKRPVTHHLLRIPDAPGARIEQEQSVRGTVPMEVHQLFSQRSGGMLVRQPFGALLTRRKGLLLFGQAHLNEGGLVWDVAIKKALGRTAAAEAAIRLLEEAAEDGAPTPASDAKVPLIIVEVEGAEGPDVGRGRP
ncbi:unnamed protein product [Prorocentrum cordatum]|uniref:Uncharacterized protein n=1 Tax=Prorocentrum cordatum TaxID=2364126 RepID=A0ABN9W237_9DINO|nr:unnamed protein product [Polarella glacialis]